MSTILVFSDYQAPHQDKWFTHLSLEYIDEAQPARIIFNGDIVNLDAIKSPKYKNDPLNDETVKASIEAAAQIVFDVRKHAPTADILWVDGNHEQRWDDWLTRQAPQVQEMSDFALENVLHLNEMGVKRVFAQRGYTYPWSHVMLGKYLEVTHGWMARRGSGASVRAMLEAIGFTHSLLVGHTHRVGMVARTKHEADGTLRTVLGIEGGCMCDIGWGLGYARTEDWQNGFVRIDMEPSGLFTYRPVLYVPGKKELSG